MDEWENEYVDSEGRSWPHYEDYVFSKFGYHNYSGCTRNAVMQTLHELWEARPREDNEKYYYIRGDESYEFAFQELLLGVLSHFDLTEYGTSPRGSWLTKKGIELLKPLFTDGPLKYIEPWENNNGN